MNHNLLKTKILRKLGYFLGSVPVLYLGIAIVLTLAINEHIIHTRTMDYLARAPQNLVSYARGGLGMDAKELNDCIRYYENLTASSQPDGIFEWNIKSMIGFTYYHLGDIQKAIKYYKQAIASNPEIYGLYYNLGYLYFQNEDYARAEKYLARIIPFSFQDPKRYSRIVPFQFGDQKKLDTVATTVEEIRMVTEKTSELLVECYRAQGKYRKMLDLSRRGVASFSAENKDYFFYSAGVAAYSLKQYKEAVKYLEFCVKINEDFAPAYQYLALCFKGLGRENLSRIALEKEQIVREKGGRFSFERNISRARLYFYPIVYHIEAETGPRLIYL